MKKLLVVLVAVLMMIPVAIAQETKIVNLPLSLTVYDVTTSKMITNGETIVSGDVIQPTVSIPSGSKFNCGGAIVITAQNPGKKSIQVAFVAAYFLGPAWTDTVTFQQLTTFVLANGKNDYKLATACDAAANEHFGTQLFEFHVTN